MSVKVLVLLSTYNGSEYIVEQLESILAQYFEGELNVLIRDDGSSDDTLDKIYGLREPRIEVIHGDNVGIKSSYMTLIELARERPVDYYAFADQDDFWLPSKIQRAVFVLMKKKRPALYCSALNLVNET
ncbi:MAG: hypothetical protein B6I36_10220 [Desulfobacteraceae bacterium 4572_35.1]|nr:MAG: hypothetical protein B6I36_10220 [Desulfobacteraceae bacterium 4572_35.1]